MNNDVISRSALLEAKWDLCDAEEAIKDAPAVDAEEVVRCKDCRWYYRSASSDLGGRCQMFGTYDSDPSVAAGEFCSRGERRDDDE